MKASMAPVFKRVETAAEMDAVDKLARTIWPQHYIPIVGKAQIDYMLDKFQSSAAINRQIGEGSQYFLIQSGSSDIGYFTIEHDTIARSTKLSKIYVDRNARGNGFGAASLEFIERLCRECGSEKLWLTVNKNNTGSINFYIANNFTKAAAIEIDIGNGFVMDDYRMEKDLTPKSA